MSIARPCYSLQQLFDNLLEQYSSYTAPSPPVGSHWEVNYHGNIDGYPAIAIGYVNTNPAASQMMVIPLCWKNRGDPLTDSDLRAECRAGVYQVYVGGDYWPTGWITSTIAPGVASALSLIFDAPISWTNEYRITVGPSRVYRWDFKLTDEDTPFASWVMEFFGPTDPVVADPYRPGFNLVWGYPNVGALHWLPSAGSWQNRFSATAGGGGGGGGDVDLSPITEKLDDIKDELRVIGTARGSVTFVREGVIYQLDPPAGTEE